MNETFYVYVLLTVLFALGLVPLLSYIRNPESDLFEPIYWASAYFLFIFGVRSIYAMKFGTPFLGDPPFSHETLNAWVLALVYAILSFVTFLLGYYSGFGVALANSLPALPRRWSLRKAKRLVVIILAISIVSLLILVNKFGGPQLFFSVERQQILTATGTTYLGYFVRLSSYALLAAYTSLLAYGELRLAVILSLPIVIMVGIAYGSKALVFTPLFGLLIIRHYSKSRLRLRYIVLFAMLVILSIPFFNLYRHSSSLGYILSSGANLLLTEPNLVIHQAMSRFHDIDSLIFIVRDTPEVMDFQLGKTIAPLIISFIPRSFWPDKPVISFGRVFSETYYANWYAGTGTAASPTIIGEAYLNFHLGGVLWIGLLSGVMVRALYHYLVRRSGMSGVFSFAIMSQYLFGGFWEANIVGLVTRSTFSLIIAVCLSLLMAKRGEDI